LFKAILIKFKAALKFDKAALNQVLTVIFDCVCLQSFKAKSNGL